MILKTTPVTDKGIIGVVTRKKIFRSDILETIEKECIKRNRISNVDCVSKNGKTYMFRTDMGEDE